MQSQAQRLISLFRIIVLAGVAALLMTSAALPMSAQNSVPPTAVQAARTPQFASRLAHPAARPASPPKPALARHGSRTGPGGGGNDIYDNGPTNGTSDAWTINFGFIVSDSFTVTQGYDTSITGMSFAAWLIGGDTLESVHISITSGENGGTSYFNQTVNFSQSECSLNQFGYGVCLETSSFNGPALNNGTYWVNLQNAVTAEGEPIYWDENSGPSSASESSVGTIPSESFTILGEPNCFSPVEQKPATAAKVVTVPPSPTQSYRVIYNFTGGADGASPSAGLVIDPAGNLYGTTSSGGPFGAGTAFKLTPAASGWRFNRVYSFSGANGSGPDSTLALGVDGTLFGTTLGGGLGDGVLFGLSPPGEVLPSVFSNWMQTLLYSFTGGSDGANPGGSLVLDSSGNIYGNAAMAGANHGGTLYEFTNGGIQVLHAFPAFPNDGFNPGGVVNGSNGLYGITGSGGYNGAGTLYTTAGGYQILHSFMSGGPEGNPTSLAADQAGNLYGTDTYTYFMCTAPGGYNEFYGTSVFQASPPDWNPSILQSVSQIGGPLSYKVSTDALGNVYGTTNASPGSFYPSNVFELTCCWNYTDLHDFAGPPNDGANPEAAPVVDAQGNIYGTTLNGGAYGQGVVWEISP
ncbi:MAG: choice-of-anchor tandem repeat GloVer-containing protein [Candidatus Korobacteraceae bacterium]|jgi:uncharacterized repeat protein (TIGR03803 family)